KITFLFFACRMNGLSAVELSNPFYGSNHHYVDHKCPFHFCHPLFNRWYILYHSDRLCPCIWLINKAALFFIGLRKKA
ncbi:MAG: hypothetical protein OSA43_10865, partial [Pirellulales bacterium]|nr:hypothetical protein [Pirellulales bacterium]